jgi:ABC-2 type transport system ATP-binding protein
MPTFIELPSCLVYTPFTLPLILLRGWLGNKPHPAEVRRGTLRYLRWLRGSGAQLPTDGPRGLPRLGCRLGVRRLQEPLISLPTGPPLPHAPRETFRAISRPEMIEAEHLTKKYGGVVAVSDLSFRVGTGEVVGFLGPNGAGKSTTLRILAGFLGATGGRVRIGGHDIVEESVRARGQIGYLPEATPLYPELRVREYLAFRAALKRVPRAKRRAALERALALSRIDDVADTLILHLSKGYRQRVGLADALIASPPLLILDEPTIGLDPNQIRDVRKLIRELGENHTILLSTHILPEVESTCDRAMVIHHGRLLAEGTIDELRTLRKGGGASLLLRDPERRAAAVLARVGGVTGVTVEDSAEGVRQFVRVSVSMEAGRPGNERVIEYVVSALVDEGIAIREVNPGRASLEEVFAQLTRSDGALAPKGAGGDP